MGSVCMFLCVYYKCMHYEKRSNLADRIYGDIIVHNSSDERVAVWDAAAFLCFTRMLRCYNDDGVMILF